MGVSEVRTAVAMGLREYRRTPVLLALLVVLPAYLVGLFGYAAPTTPVPLDVPGGGETTVALADALSVLGVQLVTGMVGGLVGLFVVHSATDADGRLVVSGFDPASLLFARGALVVVAAAASVAVSLGVLALTFTPANVTGLVVSGLLTATVYGMVGIVVGSQVDLLAGVWVIVFLPLLDVALFQNPLATETTTLATVLPAHAPMRLAVDASFVSGIDWAPLATALGYLAVTTVVATARYYTRA